jgi:AcrR family transcriptional regulator
MPRQSVPRQSAALGTHRRLFADRRRNPDGKRGAVLYTAVRMFLERSYGRTSMNDVALQLNITKPALYHYFRNKEEILVEIYRLGTDLIDEMLDSIEAEKKPGLDKVADFIAGYIRIISGDFGRAVIRLDDGELSKAGRKEVRERKRGIDHRLRRIIDGGMRDGSIAECDAKIASFLVAGSIHGITSWYEPTGPLELDAIVGQYLRILTAGLATGSLATMAQHDAPSFRALSFRRTADIHG